MTPKRSVPRAAWPVVLLGLLAASCQTDTLDLSDQERYFARIGNEENRARAMARRIRRASLKCDEYQDLIHEAEARLVELRGELRTLRSDNDKRAKEIKGLKDEAGKLAAESAELAKEKAAAAAALEKERAGLVELRKKVEDARKKHAGAAAKLDELLGEIDG